MKSGGKRLNVQNTARFLNISDKFGSKVNVVLFTFTLLLNYVFLATEINVVLYQGFKSLWHFATFGEISKCHNATLLNFVTILGFCHTVLIFFSQHI